MSRMEVDVEYLCCIGELGSSFSLPNEEGLQQALLFVHNACKREINRRDKMLFADMVGQMVSTIRSDAFKDMSIQEKKAVVNKVVNFKRQDNMEF